MTIIISIAIIAIQPAAIIIGSDWSGNGLSG
jgi:hypothetical protein